MKNNLLNCKKTNALNLFLFLWGGANGAIIFLIIYGIKVLNFTYVDWLIFDGGDLSCHYLGWCFFRIENYNFPIGVINNISYPIPTCIAYTDSIPLFAIIFKVLSPLLPSKFQYFGLWGILSFILQGGIAILLLRKITSNVLICFVGSLFFIISTVSIQRMFGHTALAAHWLILIGLYLLIDQQYFNTFKRRLIAWCILLTLCTTIHIYFIPMLLIFLFCSLIQYCRYKATILKAVILFFSAVSCSLITLYILGAFYNTNTVFGVGGLGYYSANMNTLFNPQGWSKYLINLPLATIGQYEGFAYLGLGMIIIFIIATYITINNISLENIKNNTALLIAIAISILIAVSNVVTLNGHLLMNIKYPHFVLNILDIFRSTGRFIWIAFYIIIFCSLKIVIQKTSSTGAVLLIFIFCITIQIQDLSNMIRERRAYFQENKTYLSLLQSHIWEKIKEKSIYKHIVFIDENIPQNHPYLYSIAQYAFENKMTINTFYLARKDEFSISKIKASYIDSLKNGVSNEKILYLFFPHSNLINKEYPLHYYLVNNIVIGSKYSIPNAIPYEF